MSYRSRLVVLIVVLASTFVALVSVASAATFTVTSTADTGAGTLRQAIDDANAAGGNNTISFNIAGSGTQIISLQSALPPIDTTVTIDGTTEGGYSGTPLVVLNGASAGAANGLYLNDSFGSTIEALAIENFDGDGIYASDGNGDVIEGDDIGVDPVNGAAAGNTGAGVELTDVADDTVGATSGTPNVISGNGIGIDVEGSFVVEIEGNLIGTDPTGETAVENADDGVEIQDTSEDVTVGGTGVGTGNLISGNGGSGVDIDASLNNTVEGNDIGVDLSDAVALPNENDGVDVADDSDSNLIGGTAAGSANVISGNDVYGVWIDGAGTGQNTVEGDDIGVDSTGSAAIANGGDGIVLADGTSSNTIGGTAAGSSDVISGNGIDGVDLNGSGTDDNIVEGDFIGVDAAGNAAVANAVYGVRVSAGASDNTIGGTSAAASDVISGNSVGVDILNSGTESNTVEGARIGVDAAGTAAVANAGDGVQIASLASDNTIGGSAAGEGDVISGNGAQGVEITNASHNAVEGDTLGMDVSDSSAIANAHDDIKIDGGGTDNTVGGTGAGDGNVIADAGINGVEVSGLSSGDDTILSNAISGNTNLGIALTSDGNSSFASPTISAATTSSGSTTISGTAPSGTTSVQVFDNTSCSGAQGQQFEATVSPSGTTWTASVSALTTGDGVTATATGSSGTSQFSVCQAVQLATSTSLSSSANPATSGQAVTYTATVSPVPSAGTVAFTDGASTIAGCGSVAVNSTTGQAICSHTYGAVGSHTVQAVYSGDTDDAGSASPSLSESIQSITTTALSSSANPSVAGQTVTYAATVSPLDIAGTVSFSDGGSTISGCGGVSVSPANATATCEQTYSAAGTHSVKATFSGNSDDLGSASATLTQVVQAGTPPTSSTPSTTTPTTTTTTAPTPVATSLTLSTGTQHAVIGESLTYTATITPVPAGSVVAFADNGVVIRGCEGVPVVSSIATCRTVATAAGPHSITASYAGDTVFRGANSSATGTEIATSLVLTKATVTSGSVEVELGCAKASGGCMARVTLTVPGVNPRDSVLTLGHAQTRLAAGSKRAIVVKLSAAGQRLLAEKHRLRLTLDLYSTAQISQLVRTLDLTLVAARR